MRPFRRLGLGNHNNITLFGKGKKKKKKGKENGVKEKENERKIVENFYYSLSSKFLFSSLSSFNRRKNSLISPPPFPLVPNRGLHFVEVH